MRAKLADLMKDRALACLLRECVVYCPCAVLDGLELCDTPGTGSTDPLQWKQLADALTRANVVLVVAQRTLAENAELEGELEAAGVLRRVALGRGAPGGCSLIVLSALGEKTFCTAEIFVKQMVQDGRHEKERTKGGTPPPTARNLI